MYETPNTNIVTQDVTEPGIRTDIKHNNINVIENNLLLLYVSYRIAC